jgi:hypothetical protein
MWRLPAGLVLLLGGCGGDDGEVLAVQAAPWGGASGASIGQVLQERKRCTRSAWRSVGDGGGGRIVEYACERDGAHAYLQARLRQEGEQLQHGADAEQARFEARLRGGWRELLVLERQRQEMLGRHAFEAKKDADRRRRHLEDLGALEAMKDCLSFRPQSLSAEASSQRLVMSAQACASGGRIAGHVYAREREQALARLRADLPRYDEALLGREGALQALDRTLEQQEAALRRLEEERPEAGERIRQALAGRLETMRLRLNQIGRVRELTRWSVSGTRVVYLDTAVAMECSMRTLTEAVPLDTLAERLDEEAAVPQGGMLARALDALWARCMQDPGRP